ncbi:DNA damage tolerance protein RHC31 [Nakaseomyces bracarensis]|uniref:DNA damage tolerance protein RHC31 n=1 Tax=Nakaseomyces bracarensis TaxID=273131 RepID=A0ABR4NZT9_9SACH
MADKLSEDEIALYDRQIRLWGLAAQTSMRSAKVLLVNLGSIGTEVAKNVVLSGVGHITVLDSHVVTEQDLGSQFFVGEDDVGKLRVEAAAPRLQDMNPRVELGFEHDEEKDESFYQGFNLIIATELNFKDRLRLNDISRKNNIPIYFAGSNGLFAYAFVDLISFDAVDEKPNNGFSSPELGQISRNREIISVVPRVEEDDKKIDVITTRNNYKTINEVMQRASLDGILTKKQIKKVSNVLPLTLAQLKCENPINSNEFSQQLSITCKQLDIEESTLKYNYIEEFKKQQGVEFAPVASVIGGAVSQDVINILGKSQSPLNNFIVFDGITLDMPIFEF